MPYQVSHDNGDSWHNCSHNEAQSVLKTEARRRGTSVERLDSKLSTLGETITYKHGAIARGQLRYRHPKPQPRKVRAPEGRTMPPIINANCEHCGGSGEEPGQPVEDDGTVALCTVCAGR